MQPIAQKRGLYAIRLREAPGACPDLRGGAVRCPSEEATVMALDTDRLSRICTAPGDGGIEDPWVATQQRALASRVQAQDFHAPIVGAAIRRKNVQQDISR